MQTFPLDSAIALKNTAAFNQDALQLYLDGAAPNFGKIETVTRFPGGYSNQTYCLQTAGQEWVLRMPPAGANIQSAHDMGREYRVLNLLEPHYKKIPKPLLLCDDASIIGQPFYIMERLSGVILRAGNAPKLGISEQEMQSLSTALINNLVALHTLDITTTGLNQLGKPEGYVNRQVAGWTKRYQAAQTDQIESIDQVAKWIAANHPREQTPTLLHNDYKYDNLILDPNNLSNIIGVLDWEMATVGDPLMDLGATLAYWFEAGEESVFKIYNLSWLPGNLSRQQLADHYAQATGRDLSDILFYYVFGLFKNAVIAQQIYHRYQQGNSNDPRFGALLPMIQLLGTTATSAIVKGKI
jgi:aminoglycoside phosphotransferase (APT) family kinase protein